MEGFVFGMMWGIECHLHQENGQPPCPIMCSTWFKMVLNSTWFSTWLAQHMESAHDHMCKYMLQHMVFRQHMVPAHGSDSTWQHIPAAHTISSTWWHMESAHTFSTWFLTAHGSSTWQLQCMAAHISSTCHEQHMVAHVNLLKVNETMHQ